MTFPSSFWSKVASDLYFRAADVSFYGARIQTRMVVARLRDGNLWIYSPLVASSLLIQELNKLGNVAYVLSPNKIHNQGLESFAEAYPNAKIYASPGLPERCPELKFSAVLGNAPETEWREEIDQVCTAGNHFFSEVVCLHRASKTLIVADLVETISEETVSKTNQLLAKASGVFGKAMPSPEFRLYTSDADAARSRFQTILSWEFDRIVLAHGDLVVKDAKATLQKVVEFLLLEVSTRPPWRKAFYHSMAKHQ